MKNKQGGRIGTYALLDGGSTRHVVSEKLCESLGIAGRKTKMCVTTLDHMMESERKVADIAVEGLNGFCVNLGSAIFGRIIASEGDTPPRQSDIAGMTHLEGVEFLDFPDKAIAGGEIGVIVGAEHAWIWTTGERRMGGRGTAMALETKFGWGLIGPRSRGSRGSLGCYFMSFDEKADQINKDLAKLFAREFEAVDEDARAMSVEDEYAMKQLRESIQWDPDVGHYRVAIPWKYGRAKTAEIINGMDSDRMALDRLRRSVGKIRRDPERQAVTFATMRKFDEEGYAVNIDPRVHAACPPDEPRWAIPIHVADKPGKPGQVRVCHDCRAPVGGSCLNDFILDGPAIACDLCGVIMRFRDGGKVAYGADIAAFFHNVYTHKKDAAAYRYWWFADENMRSYVLKEFQGHVFGSKSSSCVATFALRHHVESQEERYGQDVVETVKKNLYVDDLVKSSKDVETAVQMRDRITAALEEGGFDLCKWKSTHREVLVETDKFQLPESADFLSPAESTEKILGMRYDYAHDVFFFQPKMERVSQAVKNKREMLKVIASLYDPMGFIAPFVIRGRMLFQKAVRAEKSWDNELPEGLRREFGVWQKAMPEIARFQVRRWTTSEDCEDGVAELHLFSDASVEAYGAVAYRRTTGVSGSAHVAILFAKAHVVPLKVAEAAHHESIPRLELQAARLAAEVKSAIERETVKYERVVMWTDSQCVLKQLRVRDKRFRMFFANRISMIHALTLVIDWRYVPSALNPADDLSRGMMPASANWERFHRGPEFLWAPEEDWPEDIECLGPLPCGVLATKFVTVDRVRSWVLRVAESTHSWQKKLVRVAGVKLCMLAWVGRRRDKDVRLASQGVTLLQREEAEKMILREVQAEAFGNFLRGGEEANWKKAGLADLCPFVGEDGLLRCGGRLAKAAHLGYDSRCPIILPHQSSVVVDLATHLHERFLHAGVELVLGESRRRFWILKGRRVVSKAIKSCVTCQKNHKAPMVQQMAPLPAARVTVGAPFRYTGVDVFGPIRVKIVGRSFHKVWVALFTCLAVRAVHLEVLRDMSASAFINALMRFRARRPGARFFFSDNGSNFTAAEKEIRAEVASWNAQVTEELRLEGLEWSFGPPVAPHRGGVWERLVRSVKKHLLFVMQEDNLSIEVLATVLAKAEHAVNSRPLTHVGADGRDEMVLSPMNFLCPGVFAHSSDEVLPPSPPDEAVLRYSWRQSRALVDGFWKRWARDYVSALQARPKWRKVEANLAVDDVVLLVDEQVRRGDWRLGRVVEVECGDLVRTVSVRLSNGKVLRRDRTKVVRLELDPARVEA